MEQVASKKFLIIGGGLAGSSLAHHLLQRNQSVQIIDGGENHSTRVAAGMVNPLVFRRTTLSWRAADFLQYSWDFYKSLERLLNIQMNCFLQDFQLKILALLLKIIQQVQRVCCQSMFKQEFPIN